MFDLNRSVIVLFCRILLLSYRDSPKLRGTLHNGGQVVYGVVITLLSLAIGGEVSNPCTPDPETSVLPQDQRSRRFQFVYTDVKGRVSTGNSNTSLISPVGKRPYDLLQTKPSEYNPDHHDLFPTLLVPQTKRAYYLLLLLLMMMTVTRCEWTQQTGRQPDVGIRYDISFVRPGRIRMSSTALAVTALFLSKKSSRSRTCVFQERLCREFPLKEDVDGKVWRGLLITGTGLALAAALIALHS
uniref:Uncharacterized protein n=1 Tax=Timema genevievae TaxID=629358 RepID=A0A7R9JY43_TIMGE|nr:unnamed protein product [Timema genevievae]